MKAKSKIVNGESGVILIFVIVALMVAAITIPALLRLSSESFNSAMKSQDKMQRFYAADAGIEDALHKLEDATLVAAEYELQNVNGHTVNVTISKSETKAGTYLIRSTALKENQPVTTVETTVSLYNLTITSTVGGNVTNPGEGTFHYPANTTVTLQAIADSGYNFVNWTGDTGNVTNPNAASTTITMDGDYTIQANFAEPLSEDCWLEIYVSPVDSGWTMPAEGIRQWYELNEVVDLWAYPDIGYLFDNWTGQTGTMADTDAAATTITMQGNYTIVANFIPIVYSLTTTSGPNGIVIDPGEGTYFYNAGTVVDLLAEPDYGYAFINWTGGTGTIADTEEADTSITMNGNYTIQANFTGTLCYPCFDYAIASLGDDDLSIAKTVQVDYAVDGDIYALGDLILEKDARISGDAYATGNVDFITNSQVLGNVHSGGYINMQKSAVIGGNAYAEGDITVGRFSIIWNDAYAGGSVTVDSQGSVEGDIYEGYSPLPPFPELTPPSAADIIALAAYYESLAEVGGVYSGDYIVANNEVTDLGPLHITGNLIINNNAVVTLTGTVYVDGYFEIVNNASVIGPGVVCAEGDIYIQNCSTPAGLPVFMTLSDIVCKNNSYVEAALYAPNGEITLENNSSVYGAVVASSIETDNNFDITHAPELIDGEGLPPCGCS